MGTKQAPIVARERPLPDGGWSQEIERIPNALVIPPLESAFVQPCGVLFEDGEHSEVSVTWRGQRALMTRPEMPQDPPAKLSGRHLYAGQIWMHFGHFMAESLSRIWALDRIKDTIDSIVFIPKRPNRPQDLKSYQNEFFELLGIDIPVQVISEPTQVEELLVPGQGFGLGAIAAGTDQFRSFFENNFARDIKAEGPDDLYLSRSALGGLEGGALHEEALETSLARDGFETIHPQQLSLSKQVALYRAANRVAGLDGSAFHLFGFVGRPHQQAAMVLRRNSNVFRSILIQLQSFCDIDPIVIDAIAADWVPAHKDRPGRESFGEIDFPILAKMMHETGFGPPPEEWTIPRFRDMKRAMKIFSAEKNLEFNRVKKRRRSILNGAGVKYE